MSFLFFWDRKMQFLAFVERKIVVDLVVLMLNYCCKNVVEQSETWMTRLHFNCDTCVWAQESVGCQRQFLWVGWSFTFGLWPDSCPSGRGLCVYKLLLISAPSWTGLILTVIRGFQEGKKKSYVLRLWAVLYLPVLISMVAQIEGRGNSVASHCRRWRTGNRKRIQTVLEDDNL